LAEETKISINGRDIAYEYKMVDIGKLHFYIDNPRVATIVSEHEGRVTDEIIDKELWGRNETKKLYQRIQKDRGLIHPLLVYEDYVLEGNTRLCCYRHLLSETGDKNWNEARCHIIQDKLKREDILRLLCTEHIEGKIEWDAYDKANMYRNMKEKDHMTLEHIRDLTGESTTSIGYKIRAYNLMVESGVVDKTMYSHFEQLVMNGDIKEIKKHDPGFESVVIERIKDGTIRTAPHVRLVGTIYKHKDARRKFIKGGEDAESIYCKVKAEAPMTDSPIMSCVEDLLSRIPKLTREERDGIEGNHTDRSKVERLAKELVQLCAEMDIKIHVPKNLR